MLTRFNTSSEITILPTGLGNHYTSRSHLVPPGTNNEVLQKRQNSIFSRVSVGSNADDPDAPEANTSFRSESDYFGPDVLVIVGVVLASGGGILTLVSVYCEFKHPAIQATLAGIGPSLIGIGMLFCVLRLFFCSFFTTGVCCLCLSQKLHYVMIRIPCLKRVLKRSLSNKKIYPLQPKTMNNSQRTVTFNGQIKQESPLTSYFNENNEEKKEGPAKNIAHDQTNFLTKSREPFQTIEMTSRRVNGMKRRSDSVPTFRKTESATTLIIAQEKNITENSDCSIDVLELDSETHKQDEDDILRDEIANLDQRLASANSDKAANDSINDLVLKHSKT